jgi:hypothetical protein
MQPLRPRFPKFATREAYEAWKAKGTQGRRFLVNLFPLSSVFAALLLVSALLVAAPAVADRIWFKATNDYIEVETSHESNGMIYYPRYGGEISVSKNEVLRIEKTKADPKIEVLGTPAAPKTVEQPAANAVGPKTITGTLTLIDSKLGGTRYGCFGTGGYGDIHAGTQVTVTDAASRVIGVGVLEEGRPDGAYACVFAFSIKGLPETDFYGVEVQRRGVLRYSRTQLDQQGWTVKHSLALR